MRVVDLSALISGPFATMLLADQGADVIKVEPPGIGDIMRYVGSSRGGMSGLFATMNRGKRSVVLDLKTSSGRADLDRLVATADVFVENFRPRALDRLGINEPAMRAVRPDLVYVSITGFGERGPYAGKRVYDNVMQGYAGVAAVQSDPATGEPALVRNLISDKVTAYTAAQAITAALFARERGAGGQHLRLNMLDATVAFLWPDGIMSELLLGDGVAWQPPISRGYSVKRTADGFVTVSYLTDAQFRSFIAAVGHPELAVDSRFATTEDRIRHSADLKAVVDAALVGMTSEQVVAALDEADVPCAPITALGDLHLDPQIIANRTIVETDHPRAGRMREAKPPVSFSGTPAAIGGPAPALGQHTDELLAELGDRL